MKRLALITVLLASTLCHAGLYYCKSESLTVEVPCDINAGCSGTCEIDTWARGYCGMLSVADCYVRSASAGGTAVVTKTFRICTATYGCACDRGDIDHTYTYVGQVDQCSDSPFIPGDPGDTPGNPSNPKG